jgi:hypothetical protein
MGMSMSCFLGPYLVARTKQVEATEYRRSCRNKKCKQYDDEIYGGGNFCSLCGKAIVDVPQKVTEDAIDRHELQEQIDERLYVCPGDDMHDLMRQSDFHLWLPNLSIPKCRDFQLHENTMFFPISAANIEEEVAAFKKFYAKEIKVLRKAYGEDAIEVKWGVASYYW